MIEHGRNRQAGVNIAGACREIRTVLGTECDVGIEALAELVSTANLPVLTSMRAEVVNGVNTSLAVNGNGGCVSLKDIAEREHLSEKYLEQIVNQLSKAGLEYTGFGKNYEDSRKNYVYEKDGENSPPLLS